MAINLKEGEKVMDDKKIKELERERDYWKECYEVALTHLKEIENQYFIKNGTYFKYKETT